MSLTAVRPFFRSVMNSFGYTEWTDGFNWQNIPSTIIDGTYHLELQTSQGIKQNQSDQEIFQPIVVRLFLKGFRDPSSGIDSGMLKCENIIKEAINQVGRYPTTILNIEFVGSSPEPFAVSNDNLIIMRMEFKAFIVLAPNN